MGKAKRGQSVRFNGNGKVGVIQSVSRGVVRVIFRDGSHGYGHAGQFSKASGGCLLILAVPALVLVAGVIAYGSQAA